MQFVNKQKNIAGFADFVHHFAHPVFKFTAIFRTGHHGRHIQRDEPFGPQRLRHLGVNNPLRQAFRHRCLAYARLANQHGVVFSAPTKNLQNPLNLTAATNNGVNLPVFRQLI